MELRTPASTHQPLMKALEQVNGDGTGFQGSHAPTQGSHVVGHLGHVRRAPWIVDTSFRLKQVAQRTLGALNLAGEHRFPTHEHEDEQVRIWQNLNGTVQPSQLAVRCR